MNNQPFISIITVSFNASKTIGRTLESLRKQSNKDFESIVIDGGSTDGTTEVVKEFSDVVGSFISEPDKGIYDAMNKGVAKAKGRYIGFLNSDDAYFPDTVQNLIDCPGQEGIIYGNIRKERVLDGEVLFRNEKPNLKLMKETMGVFHPASFVKAELFSRYGGFDLSYKLAADYHWFLRAYLNGAKFSYIDKELALFSVGGISNISCESYREAALIQKELGVETYRQMEDLHSLCLKKSKRQRLIAKFAEMPILREFYKSRVKKRWS